MLAQEGTAYFADVTCSACGAESEVLVMARRTVTASCPVCDATIGLGDSVCCREHV